MSEHVPPPLMDEAGGQNDAAFESSYLAFLADYIRSSKRLADRPMVLFVVLRLLLIVASSILPLLAAQKSDILPYVAAGVTALTLLDINFRWGEEWKHFRATQIALERLRREYAFRRHSIANGRPVGAVTSHLENLQVLQDAVENLAVAETDKFFSFRVAAMKDAGAKSVA